MGDNGIVKIGTHITCLLRLKSNKKIDAIWIVNKEYKFTTSSYIVKRILYPLWNDIFHSNIRKFVKIVLILLVYWNSSLITK